VSETVATVLLGLSVVIAVWAVVLVVLDRRINNPLFYTAAALELVLVAQMVGGFVALGVGDRPIDGITFSGYLLTAVVVMPIGVAWGASDKSRWGPGVVAISAFVVLVLVVRLGQIWQGIDV
jgi:hypothetical protein